MKKIYRIVAGVLAALGGFAAIGAGLMIVATAIVVGAMVALAAKLAIKGMVPDTASGEPLEADQVPA